MTGDNLQKELHDCFKEHSGSLPIYAVHITKGVHIIDSVYWDEILQAFVIELKEIQRK